MYNFGILGYYPRFEPIRNGQLDLDFDFALTQPTRTDLNQPQTHLGEVRCKLATLNGRVVNAKPEFDDCAEVGCHHNVCLEKPTLTYSDVPSI